MQYIVTIDLPDEMTEEFLSLIPEHRARINKLMQRGIILSYSLNADRTNLWIIMNAKNEAEINKVLHTLPLHDFFVRYSSQLLMFHNSVAGVIPSISLN